MAVTKLQIYNGACILLGARALSSDTEDREIRYDLDALYAAESGLDYCLEVVKPKFALKVDQVTGIAATQETEYTYQIAIPATQLALEGMYFDGKLTQPIKKFYREGAAYLTDAQSPYLRYVEDFSTVGLTNMSPSFSRVVSAYFARELANKYNPDLYAEINEELEARIQISIGLEGAEDSDERPLDPTVLDGDWLAIYNDIMNLYGLDPISSVNDDSYRKSRLDQARTAEIVEACMEDVGWHFASVSQKMFYDPSIDPEWGYQYAFERPAECHRIDGLFSDEHFRDPVKYYQEEYDSVADKTFFYSSYQIMYIKYISSDYVTDSTLWPSYFKRFVAAQMAIDAHAGVKKQHPEIESFDVIKDHYARRRSEAKSTDAITSPPRVIAQGSWSRSRREFSRRDRP